MAGGAPTSLSVPITVELRRNAPPRSQSARWSTLNVQQRSVRQLIRTCIWNVASRNAEENAVVIDDHLYSIYGVRGVLGTTGEAVSAWSRLSIHKPSNTHLNENVELSWCCTKCCTTLCGRWGHIGWFAWCRGDPRRHVRSNSVLGLSQSASSSLTVFRFN